MCTCFETTTETKFTGYKVVAKHKKNGKYHSIMTGNKYPCKEKNMPVWYSERRGLLRHFGKVLPGNKDTHSILLGYTDKERMRTGWRSWKEEMVGRTAAFQFVSTACKYQDSVMRYIKNYENFEIVTVKVCLTESLIKAEFMEDRVFGGKRIEILEEVY